ncbi:MAG: hypothetical protein ACREKN_05270 [Longimicrobiaceae bacterium]
MRPASTLLAALFLLAPVALAAQEPAPDTYLEEDPLEQMAEQAPAPELAGGGEDEVAAAELQPDTDEAANVQDPPRNWLWLILGIVVAGLLLAALL